MRLRAFRLPGATLAVELGALYRKTGPAQPVWRVDSLLRHTPLPHVKLTRLDGPTQMTISVVTLMDSRFFQRVPA